MQKQGTETHPAQAPIATSLRLPTISDNILAHVAAKEPQMWSQIRRTIEDHRRPAKHEHLR